jgi:hypothetical protein
MSLFTMFWIVAVATLITTWYNDNISKADYIADEA